MNHRHPTAGRLTDDQYLCPSCFAGGHQCVDLFNLPPFGLVACACDRPSCNPKDTP